MESFAFADALRHFETALDLWSSLDDPESVAGLDLASLLDQAANIASLDGQTRRGAALREAAIAELGPGADPVQAALWQERLGRQRWLAADTAGALRAYDEAMAMAAPPSPARARVLSGYGQLPCSSIDGTNRVISARRRSRSPVRPATARSRVTPCAPWASITLRSVDRVKGSLRSRRPTASLSIGNFDDVGRANVNLANALFTPARPIEASVVPNGMAEAERLGVASSYGC